MTWRQANEDEVELLDKKNRAILLIFAFLAELLMWGVSAGKGRPVRVSFGYSVLRLTLAYLMIR